MPRTPRCSTRSSPLTDCRGATTASPHRRVGAVFDHLTGGGRLPRAGNRTLLRPVRADRGYRGARRNHQVLRGCIAMEQATGLRARERVVVHADSTAARWISALAVLSLSCWVLLLHKDLAWSTTILSTVVLIARGIFLGRPVTAGH